MILPLLLTLASVPPKTVVPPSATAPAQTSRPSLFEIVEQRMSAQGRPIFQRYVTQTLLPQAQADAAAQRRYIQSLRSQVVAPTLDINAIANLIDRRKQSEAAATSAIRSSAFTMIRTLPASDQKLALTAIFADARLPASAQTPAVHTSGSSDAKKK
jgi:hypothetical protein